VPEVLVSSVAVVVSHVAFPALSRRRRDEPRALAQGTLALVRYQALYALPAAAGIAVLAAPLTVVLFSSTWAAAAGVTAAIAVKAALRAVGHPLGDALKAVARQRTMVALGLCELPLLVGLVLAVAEEGIATVAWALVAVDALHLVALAALAARIVAVAPAKVVRALGPGVAAAAGVAAGAGAVRLGWDAETLPALLAGVVAGAAGGMAALSVCAPRQARALVAQLGRSG
jgi:O-antigen/teichoic acid export membrane protein